MAKKAQKIVNKKALAKLLNKALSDEWFAYYRYWVGAKVMAGDMRTSAASELEELATDELKHACILVERIIQLEGKPVLNPGDWCKIANCGYEAPKDFSVKSILFQNIKGKQCAIDAYKNLIELTKDKDSVSHEILVNILNEEIEQKDDLINILEHLEIKES
jgi:bacterioferritin